MSEKVLQLFSRARRLAEPTGQRSGAGFQDAASHLLEGLASLGNPSPQADPRPALEHVYAVGLTV
ncbi:MAG: hypothetical protein QW587_01690 [Candidatus Bathyarchaeia archaeon]